MGGPVRYGGAASREVDGRKAISQRVNPATGGRATPAGVGVRPVHAMQRGPRRRKLGGVRDSDGGSRGLFNRLARPTRRSTAGEAARRAPRQTTLSAVAVAAHPHLHLHLPCRRSSGRRLADGFPFPLLTVAPVWLVLGRAGLLLSSRGLLGPRERRRAMGRKKSAAAGWHQAHRS